MKLTKEEQLRRIFKKKLTEVYFDSYDRVRRIELQPEEAEERYIDESVEELLKEVSIRFYIKGE